MRFLYYLMLIAFTAGLLLPRSARAAEIEFIGPYVGPHDYAASNAIFETLQNPVDLACRYKLSGPIEPGDLERLQHALESGSTGAPAILCLDSKGGSFAEAVRIAEYIDRRFVTMVDKDQSCLSACAIIFMSGGYSDVGKQAYRILRPGAQLGFHAPSITLPDTTYSKETAEQVYGTALADLTRALRGFATVKPGDQSREPILPVSLLIEMLLTPPDKMMMVETVNQVARWEIELAIQRPEIDPSQGLFLLCYNAVHWAVGEDAPAYTVEALQEFVPKNTGGSWHLQLYPEGDTTEDCYPVPEKNSGVRYDSGFTNRWNRRYTSRSHYMLLPGPTRLDSLK
ncbi:hypothetical protein [Pseudooceanicola sp. 200-1SW]|uniref:COG3904 family protein n=1 Tax=Pseudooceanicola sp. 200-1SW TaxID=3425949 RepID=UPI003D7FC45C